MASSVFVFSFFLFIIGTFGVFFAKSKRHFIVILVSLEIILLASVINFVSFSFFCDDILGQIFALLILTVAAAESALGLAILILFYRRLGGIFIDLVKLLKR